MVYTVSEVAEKLGVSASSLRFYERHGLLPSVARTPGGVRQFTEADVARVREILLLRECGFAVKELAEWAALPPGSEARRNMLRARQKGIRAELARLTAALATLDSLA